VRIFGSDRKTLHIDASLLQLFDGALCLLMGFIYSNNGIRVGHLRSPVSPVGRNYCLADKPESLIHLPKEVSRYSMGGIPGDSADLWGAYEL
jgi:hypothetical protein